MAQAGIGLGGFRKKKRPGDCLGVFDASVFRWDSLIFVVSKGQEGEENDGEKDQPGREACALPKRLRQLVIREDEDDDIHKRNQA